jgi:hypothetical protein
MMNKSQAILIFGGLFPFFGFMIVAFIEWRLGDPRMVGGWLNIGVFASMVMTFLIGAILDERFPARKENKE